VEDEPVEPQTFLLKFLQWMMHVMAKQQQPTSDGIIKIGSSRQMHLFACCQNATKGKKQDF